MGHYDECYEATEKAARDKFLQAVQGAMVDLKMATKTIPAGLSDNDRKTCGIAVERCAEALLWLGSLR